MKSGRITSSPGPIPSAASATCSAVVPLLVVTAWRTPMNSAKRASKRATAGPPEEIQPEAIASAT